MGAGELWGWRQWDCGWRQCRELEAGLMGGRGRTGRLLSGMQSWPAFALPVGTV